MPKDLQTSLLLRIMQRLGDFRDQYPNLVTTPDLHDLAVDVTNSEGELQALHYLDRHVVFLSERGYVQLGSLTVGGTEGTDKCRVAPNSSRCYCYISVRLVAEPLATHQPQAIAHGLREAESVAVTQHAIPCIPLASENQNH